MWKIQFQDWQLLIRKYDETTSKLLILGYNGKAFSGVFESFLFGYQETIDHGLKFRGWAFVIGCFVYMAKVA